jgi:hypothetical protein
LANALPECIKADELKRRDAFPPLFVCAASTSVSRNFPEQCFNIFCLDHSFSNIRYKEIQNNFSPKRP